MSTGNRGAGVRAAMWVAALSVVIAVAGPAATAAPEAKPMAAAAAKAPPADALRVPYPKGYRDWTHIKSMVIYNDKHDLFGAFGGIHHIYANDKALWALKNKKDFPNGSTIVLDLLDIGNSPGAYAEAKRKFIGVITRDTVKYKVTDGWGWQAFEGGDPEKPALKSWAEQKACNACHQQVGSKYFVFSEYRP